MAKASISKWLCEPCENAGENKKARTFCFECKKLLCEPCSDSHLRDKLTENHHLLELQFMKKSTSRHDASPPRQPSPSINEDELASDFLEHVPLTENSVLYRRAQVAKQSTISSKSTTSKVADHRREKATPSEPSKPTTPKLADQRQEKATPSYTSKPTTPKLADQRQEKATPSGPSKRTAPTLADQRQEKATPSDPSKRTTPKLADQRREKATPSDPSKPTTPKLVDQRQEKATPSGPSKRTTPKLADQRQEKATPSEPSKPTTPKLADQRQEKATPSRPSKRTTPKLADQRQEKATPSEPSKPTTSKVAVPRLEKATSLEPIQCTTSKQTDPRRLKATLFLQYGVKRQKDKASANVKGLMCVSHTVVVVEYHDKALKLFDQSGTYLSSTALQDDTWGITYVSDSTFATCGGYNNKINLWTVRGNTVVSQDVFHVEHMAWGIHYNGTYCCVLHNDDNAVTILNRQGGQVRKIVKKEACGKKFGFGCDIHMDSDTHNIYVPCWFEHGVLCMTVEGRALWFTPLSRLLGITEIQGTLCVADVDNACLHMITKEGEYVRKLLHQEDLGGQPKYICYGQDGKLYVSYSSGVEISVFKFT